MKVLKFGGSSVGSAQGLRQVRRIVAANDGQIVVVVSALGGITDRLLATALPRVRDFRGIPDRGFDGRGNFTLGIKEHAIFPEMEADRIENPKGMNITIVTTATTDKEGKFLLEQLGMPFRK